MRTSHHASLRTVSTSIVVGLLSVASAGPAAAQVSAFGDTSASRSPLALRSSGSVSVIQTRPQGALGRNIALGYGVNGAYLVRIDRAGVLSLRADAGIAAYGNESKHAAFSETVGGRVQVDVRTTNYIVPISVGPQLAWPRGMVRPYVNAGVGGQWFVTESDVEHSVLDASFASTSNHSAFAAAWTTGAGLYVPLRAGRRSAQLDIGMRYVNGGKSEYLAPGSITDLPGGQIRIAPMESSTHLIMLHIGANIGL